ncbi:hypothetical protein [Halorubellus sp. PRR65]|uniref:hypothetical protein n=1 Tax=Halorubellus sp. PRR65 TaxID=3098148 RepID=UPI002B258CC8|nr:hypothetical protein [Halorubellus sp. PRR65]
MNLDELDLEREDVEVLREVANHGDRGVTTGEVVRVVGWATENHHVTYRFNKLEERGLIASRQESARGQGNQIDPRVAYATDAGEELAEEVEFDPSNAPMDERLERLEKQMGKMRDTYGAVKQRIVGLEDEVEELEDEFDRDLEELNDDIEGLKRTVNNGEDSLVDELEFGD